MYTYFLYGLCVEAVHVETLEVVGSMFIREDQVIKSIHVNPPHRRKGVATGMYNFATQEGFILKHSDSRTLEGEKWIQSLSKSRLATCQNFK